MSTPSVTLGTLLTSAMEAKGMSTRSVSEAADITYEHARKALQGIAVPSKFVIKALCDVLDVDYQTAEGIANAERMVKKYGEAAQHLIGVKQGMEPIQQIWDDLTPDQQQDAISMLTGWATKNRRLRAS